MITNEPFIECSNCRKKTDKYYLDLFFKDEVCSDCLISLRGGFPTGKGVYIPCKLCKGPYRWFYIETYGKIKKDCGNHVTREDMGFNIFD